MVFNLSSVVGIVPWRILWEESLLIRRGVRAVRDQTLGAGLCAGWFRVATVTNWRSLSHSNEGFLPGSVIGWWHVNLSILNGYSRGSIKCGPKVLVLIGFLWTRVMMCLCLWSNGGCVPLVNLYFLWCHRNGPPYSASASTRCLRWLNWSG